MSQKIVLKDRNINNPGPGSYIRFSEFGILSAKKRKLLFSSSRKGKSLEESKILSYKEDKNVSSRDKINKLKKLFDNKEESEKSKSKIN